MPRTCLLHKTASCQASFVWRKKENMRLLATFWPFSLQIPLLLSSKLHGGWPLDPAEAVADQGRMAPKALVGQPAMREAPVVDDHHLERSLKRKKKHLN